MVAFFVSTAEEARGGRGGFGGRSFSRPAPTKHYAPKPTKRTTIVKKNTTVINQTVHQSAPTSSGGGFWSSMFGATAGMLFTMLSLKKNLNQFNSLSNNS